MNIDSIDKRFIRFNVVGVLSLILVYVVSALCTRLVLEKFMNAQFLSSYYYIPASFLLTGMLTIIILNVIDISNQKRILQVMLIVKVLKMFVFGIAAVLFIAGLGVSFKHFLLIAGISYMLYLVFETIFLFRFEKLIKRK